MAPLALIRGGGELGSAIAHALAGAGFRLLVVDRALPGALRLGVSFAAAAVGGRATVAGVEAVLCQTPNDVPAAWARGQVALWTGAESALALRADVLVDARMRSITAKLTRRDDAAVTIGIGPGFVAGEDVHYVIESNRGPRLGRVVRAGAAEPHTGIPGEVAGHRETRILRAPCAGRFVRTRTIGDFVEPGDAVGAVEGRPVRSLLSGMIRGLKLTGVEVGEGHKVGDVDPRRDPELLTTMTDKARAVAAGTLEALALSADASSAAPPARAPE